MLLHCVGVSLALLFGCPIIKADWNIASFCNFMPIHFSTLLEFFACLATQMRLILIRVNFGVLLLRIKALVFKILKLSIVLIKLSYNIL
jgi:hypothetical protein